MKHLKSYAGFITESVSIDLLEPGTEVTYKRNNGQSATKPIHRIDPQKKLVYFIGDDMREFSKPIDKIMKVSN